MIPGLAASLTLAPAGSRALELVPGGYGAAPAAAAQLADDPLDLGDAAAGEPGLALGFTPRGAVGSWFGSGATVGEQDPDIRFDLTVRGGGTPDFADRFVTGTSRDALRASAAAAPSALTVGGAMRWSDWSVGGGLGRAQVLGESVDLMSATLGYGRVTAELAFGQSEPAAGAEPQDVLMLSTDLAAWSWLTLESAIAVGSRGGELDRDRADDREPVAAAGRFGLRLNF